MPDRLEQLLKLHAADPTDADVPYMIAMEHTKAADHTQVLHWLDQTLGLDPNYLYAYYQKAKALHALGRADEAKAACRQGLDKAQAAGDAKAASELNELMATLG